jgi:EmrB/QacA subfamily drug resistance transporter
MPSLNNRLSSVSPWASFGVCSLAMFLVMLDTTILFVAFQDIRDSFAGTSVTGLSWVLNAYTIVYGALLVPAGRLADLYGRKWLFVIAVVIFTFASALCGFAGNPTTLIGFRVLQAVGAALLTPASLALVLGAFPPQKRAIAVSLWGAVGALAAAVGPALGSFIVASLGWRWVFFINLPVGLVALALAVNRLKESRSPEAGALPDVPGILMLIFGVGCVALGVVNSSEWTWTAPATWYAIVLGLLILAGFVAWAARVKSPALDLTLFRDANFRFANIATFVFSVTFTAMFFGFFFFLTRVWGYSLPIAGLAVTPGPLMVIPVAVLAGRRAERLGHRALLVGGGIIFAVGAAWYLLMLEPTPNYLSGWLPGLLMGGIGVGLILPSLTAAAVSGLPVQRFGVGSAVNLSIRQMGSVFGVALVIALLGNASGPAAISHFHIHFAVLVIGGLLTALFSVPIDTKPILQNAPERPNEPAVTEHAV